MAVGEGSETIAMGTAPLLATIVFMAAATLGVKGEDPTATPNVVIILADDLGYGDIGCFGNTTIQTPHLDKLASQGVKLTHNLAAYSICTPSRAAFLTGRYSVRSGMLPLDDSPAFPLTAIDSGLPASETTTGEVAKKAGYRTAFLGKWHQGWSVDRSNPDHHHPLNQGFDYFYGIPLSNMPDFGDDGVKLILAANPHMTFQLLATFTLVLVTFVCLVRERYVSKWVGIVAVAVVGVNCSYIYFPPNHSKLLNSFMFRNYDLVEQPVHLPSVTRKLVKESEDFLQARHEDSAPFLLLVSWLHVHTALATAPQFSGQSAHGPYGDAVQEMDWGVGQLMDMLERYGMASNTWVYFTSDHGADILEKDGSGRITGGHNGIFSGSKGDGGTEGAIRVPGIVRWPGRIAAGQVISEPVSLMDVLPTLAALLHVPLDSVVTSGHVVDGASLVPLLTGLETVSPHEFLFHYCQDSVHAVRYRPRTGKTTWKLMLREPDPKISLHVMKRCRGALHLDPPRLYDLTLDPFAAFPLDPGQHPQVMAAILKAFEDHRQSVTPVPSQFAWYRMLWKPWNQPCCNFPWCECEDDKFTGTFLDG